MNLSAEPHETATASPEWAAERPAHRASWTILLGAAALAAVTLAVWFPVVRAQFVSFDDNVYVTENREVGSGLTIDGIRWAFTTRHAGLWHPLAWLSHMLDVQLFGLDPGGHHATSLVLHAANVALLFLLLRRTAANAWAAAIASALFALHPLRVESVAWVADRRDVLSMFFGLLALHAYVGFAAARSLGRYVFVLLAFAAAVMANPMLATLPAVMLLLDYWPLRRVGRTTLVLEKVPLALVAAAAGAATLLAAREQSALIGLEELPLGPRLAAAAAAYGRYLAKAVWPSELAVNYPITGTPPATEVGAAVALLVGITVLTFLLRQRAPYLLVGWLWFVVTLLPVSGLVQSGGPTIADRFTYLPLTGLLVAVAWTVADVRWPAGARAGLAVAAVAVLVVLGLATRRQLAYWQDGTTLMTRTLEVTGDDNWMVHSSLGDAFVKQGDGDGAARHFEAALRLQPNDAKLHYDMGVARLLQNRLDEAGGHFTNALRLRPDFADAEFNIGQILARQVRYPEAVEYLERAVRHDPASANIHAGYGTALLHVGRVEEAVAELREATRLDPRHAIAHFNLARVLVAQGLAEEAGKHFEAAFEADPSLRPQAMQQ